MNATKQGEYVTTDYGTEVAIPGPFTGLAAIRAANRNAGQHFFDPSSLRFFSSRIGRTSYRGRLFVTSEQFHGSDGYVADRLYTVRCAMDDGSIETVGGFQQYATSSAARAAILSGSVVSR